MNQMNNIYNDFEERSSPYFLEIKQKWDNQEYKYLSAERIFGGGVNKFKTLAAMFEYLHFGLLSSADVENLCMYLPNN